MEEKIMNELFHNYVFEFYQRMKVNQINLIYEGEITHQITKAFTALAEESMSKDQESNAVQMKVFHVIVESLQNISKHANEAAEEDQRGIGTFLVAKSETDYFILAGNRVDKAKINEIKVMLNTINSCSKEELKSLHKDQMRKGRLSEKGGAGLGFIDIARKSGNPLEYEFKEINSQTSFFILSTKVSRTQNK